MYESVKYWNDRFNPNKRNGTNTTEESYLPEFLKGAINILDFGCGVGRTFKFYKNAVQVFGVDFSENYRQRAIQEAHDQNLNYKHIIHNVHQDPLPLSDRTIEKGLLLRVLLHAPPGEVETIIKEMGRVCNEVLLISYHGTSKGLSSHCFAHDYVDLVEKLGFAIKFKEITKDQIVLIYDSSSSRN